MNEKSHKSCEDEHKMSVHFRASRMVAMVAGERGWNDTRASWLGNAARILGFDYERTRSIFYRRARIISAQEWITLNDTLASLKKRAAERQETLHEIQVLARSVSAPAVDSVRPLVVDGDEPSEARLRTIDKAR